LENYPGPGQFSKRSVGFKLETEQQLSNFIETEEISRNSN